MRVVHDRDAIDDQIPARHGDAAAPDAHLDATIEDTYLRGMARSHQVRAVVEAWDTDGIIDIVTPPIAAVAATQEVIQLSLSEHKQAAISALQGECHTNLASAACREDDWRAVDDRIRQAASILELVLAARLDICPPHAGIIRDNFPGHGRVDISDHIIHPARDHFLDLICRLRHTHASDVLMMYSGYWLPMSRLDA